jgi:hypothetical protein
MLEPGTIRAIASEIAKQTIWGDYKFYILVAAISLVSAVVGSFLSSYFKKRGEGPHLDKGNTGVSR